MEDLFKNVSKSKSEISFYILVQSISIYFGFGSLFLVISVFYYLYKPSKKITNKNIENKDKLPKLVAIKKNKKKQKTNTLATPTLSAYSVFNKNGESITGTLTVEQLEKEMRRS